MTGQTPPQPVRGDGRSLAPPAFPDDDGTATAGLVDALSAAVADGAHRARAWQVLAAARLLVPVVAILDESEEAPADDPDAVVGDKESHMAAVLLTGRDGRPALLAFSSAAAMQRWNPDARPVAVSARDAACSAQAEGAAALLIDVASDWMTVVEGVDLVGLASGGRPVPSSGGGYFWLAAEA